MEINQEIFRGYDIRGVANKDLDAAKMEKIGQAYGTYLRSINVDKSIIGYDNRLTSEEYHQAVIKGLLETGINVTDIGLALTPIVYWAQYYFKSKGCVMITASHNPAEYNGLKLGRGFSDTLVPIQEIKKLTQEEKFTSGEGKLDKADPAYIDDYYSDLLGRVNKIGKFKVVVDASNSASGKFMPELLRKAGCEVIEQNCTLDGNFPNGTPDPTEEKIAKRMGERVVKENADIGFSFDADGDRMGLVDDKGRMLLNDLIVAVFADDVISKNPGAKIVYNTLCSRVVDDVIKTAGGEPVMWITGHAFIKDKVNELKSPFGGELSGHFYFLDRFYGHDDGGYSALRVLDYLTQKGGKLSEIIDSFPKYISSPEIKVGCADGKKIDVVKSMAQDMKTNHPNGKVIEIDGARIDFPDGMMIIRASQNGPYLTVKYEAKDENTYEKRRQYIIQLLKKYPEIDWSEGTNLEQLQ